MKTVFSFIILSCIFLIHATCASPPDDDNNISSNNTDNTGDHGFDGLDDPDMYNNDDLTWQSANLTQFESYPDPNSEECIEYNGCEWEGLLAYMGGRKMTESWIRYTNIIAVHSDDYPKYKGKVIRILQKDRQIDAMVYDFCADEDCDGCCTRNSKETGFLIDMEYYTFNKFYADQGVVQWACLDCD